MLSIKKYSENAHNQLHILGQHSQFHLLEHNSHLFGQHSHHVTNMNDQT